jgi:hypothetical protein
VPEVRGSQRLALKPDHHVFVAADVRAEHLDRHLALEARLPSEVDLSEPAAADLGHDLEIAALETCSWRQNWHDPALLHGSLVSRRQCGV